MSLRGCPFVRRRLEAYHDRELAIEDQIAVEAHLRTCPACATEASEIVEVGATLRSALTPVDNDSELDGLAAGVVIRLKAERDESLAGRTSRFFEDLHVVWAAVGAAGATVACLVLMVGLFYLGGPERPDSLNGLIDALASPGSDENPLSLGDARVRPPRAYAQDGVLPNSVLDRLDENELVFALAAVLSKDGRLHKCELLNPGTAERKMALDLMDSISRARFEPARYGNSPVAVNVVWLVSHVTVRPLPSRPAAQRFLPVPAKAAPPVPTAV